MFPSRFRYEAPRSLDEAIAVLGDGGDYAKVLAGGQSLVPMMKLRFASPEMIVDINNLPGLAYHRTDPDGSLRIGALCRHADLERSALLKGTQPPRARAAGARSRWPSSSPAPSRTCSSTTRSRSRRWFRPPAGSGRAAT